MRALVRLHVLGRSRSRVGWGWLDPIREQEASRPAGWFGTSVLLIRYGAAKLERPDRLGEPFQFATINFRERESL